MLVNIFKSNQKVISLFVILLSVLLWVPSFWIEQEQLINKDSIPFYISNKVLIFLISSLLIGAQGVYLNFIVNEFKLLKTQTHLPALFFVLLNVGISSLLTFTPLIVVNTLLLFVLHQGFLIYNQNKAFSLAFNIGFVIAVATLIYFPVIILFPLIWISLLYTKPSNFRELLIAVLGFMVPIAFYVAYYFVTDQLLKLITFDWGGNRIFYLDMLQASYLRNSFFYVLYAVGVLAGLFAVRTFSQHVVKVRKYLVILFLFLILSLATMLLNSSDAIASYILMTIPLTVFYAAYFISIKRKWLAELIFTVLIIALVVGYFS